jgi:hypothetical protein
MRVHAGVQARCDSKSLLVRHPTQNMPQISLDCTSSASKMHICVLTVHPSSS